MNVPIWEDGSWIPLPPVSGTVTAEVCVVGLGGSGLMAVEELVTSGVNVIGLDAGLIGGGAAGRNAGFLLAGLADFFHDLERRIGPELAASLYGETLAELDTLRQAHPDEIATTGVLRLAADEAEERDCASQLAALRRHGFPAEPYAGPEGRGLLTPTDGTFQPLRFLRRLAQRLLAAGARLHEHAPLTGLSPGRVTTPGGAILCDTVIVAVDGGLEQVLPELAPCVRTARLQMLATAPAAGPAITRPVYWRYGYEYWQQIPGGAVVLGGFRDAGGTAEWTAEATPSALVQERLERFLREHLRVTAPITHRWAASVAYAADRLPILEKVQPRILAAGAYSGTGNVAGRVNGRAAARLALGRPSPWADCLAAARRRLPVDPVTGRSDFPRP